MANRLNRKGKIFQILALVLIALVLTIYAFYGTKLVLGRPLWGGFWAFTIFVSVWLIVGVVRVLRDSYETDKPPISSKSAVIDPDSR